MNEPTGVDKLSPATQKKKILEKKDLSPLPAWIRSCVCVHVEDITYLD